MYFYYQEDVKVTERRILWLFYDMSSKRFVFVVIIFLYFKISSIILSCRFIFFFLFWQMSVYFYYQEVMEVIKRRIRWLFYGMAFVIDEICLWCYYITFRFQGHSVFLLFFFFLLHRSIYFYCRRVIGHKKDKFQF